MPTPASATPSGSSQIAPRRSDHRPNSGCTSDEETVEASISVAASVYVSPNRSTRNGSSAGGAPFAKSVPRWPLASSVMARLSIAALTGLRLPRQRLPPTWENRPMPIRVCVAGVTGWTGRAIAEAVEAADDLELVAGVSRSDPNSFSSVAEALDAVQADVLVDYTHATAVRGNVLAAIERRVAVVVGSSGLSTDDYAEIDALAREQQVGVIAAGNFSLTAALLLRFAADAARHLDAWEIVDYASAAKTDAPSGTSREVAERLAGVRPPALGVPIEEVHGTREARGATVAGTQVHSLRLPSFVVSTEVVFAAEGERLSLRHDAGETPAPYVAGTLLAIRAVPGRAGLTRGLDHLLD